jgi:predicted ATPase/GAF domain-containing protein
VARLKYEYSVAKDLASSGVVHVICLETIGNALSIVMEDTGGVSLRQVLESRRLPVEEALRITISVTDTLESVHRSGVVHMDIKPDNILLNADPPAVRLMDFGSSLRLTKEAKSPRVIEGTYDYMSPEQTGRTNRLIDRRTDLYSLGVTLYEMLTGSLPFDAADPSEQMYNHIAKIPQPPHQVSPEVPEAISNIVVKLLSKMPEDRYSTAFGLKTDLEECLSQLRARGAVESFPLGRSDRPEELRSPQKLYGRAAELATLADAWERASRGSAELVLVSGYPGIGKSALVYEIQKSIVSRRGYFIAGKFDQLSRSTPYAAVAQAFRSLIQYILTQRSEVVSAWKEEIQNAVGSNGRLIVELIPELDLIIGPQPEVRELPATEAQNRFGFVFQNFARAFASAEHPLVLFLDDLHWADPASLRTLQLLLTDPTSAHLTVIGALRGSEAEPAHLLWRAIKEIEDAGIIVHRITLGPLDVGSVTALIADTLGCSAERAAPLAAIVHQKTQGNPFFIGQFLGTIYLDGLIRFDKPTGSWTWDTAQIQGAMVTDNVIDFIVQKIHKLPEPSQRALKLASCIGHQFDLKTLAAISDEAAKDVAAVLGQAMEEGLIVPLQAEYRFFYQRDDIDVADAAAFSVSYRFLHDRVQQAAHAGMDPEAKGRIHLRIGRLLRAEKAQEKQEEALFDALDHLKNGAEYITDPEEQLDVARLALVGGKRARSAAAYQAAASYLELGASLLGELSFARDHSLAFELLIALAECEHLAGRVEKAESLLEDLKSRALSKHELARIQVLRMIVYTIRTDGAGVLRAGLDGLALFGIKLPESPDAQQAALGEELAAVGANLAGRKIEELIDAPSISDPDMQVVLELLVELTAGVSLLGPVMLAVTIVKQVNISLKYGHAAASAYGYVGYGYLLASLLGQPKQAVEFGRLGIGLGERLNALHLKCRLNQLFAVYAHFAVPLRDTFEHTQTAYEAGIESGDFPYLSFTCGQTLMHRFCVGDDIADLREEVERLLTLTKRTKSKDMNAFLQIGKQAIASLEGRTKDPCSLSDDTFNEVEFAKYLDEQNLMFPCCWYYTLKLELFYLHGRYADALAAAREAEKRSTIAIGFHFTTELELFTCLTLAALYPSASPEEKDTYLTELTARQAKLGALAEGCPDNYRHKNLLVLAEQASLSGKELTAMELYDRAITSAHANEFTQHEALANELCAKFYMAHGRERSARSYVSDAYNAYVRWGATTKVEGVAKSYPSMLIETGDAHAPADIHESSGRPRKRTTTSRIAYRDVTKMISMELLDTAALMRTAQAIAGEVHLDKVLERLMRIVLENAGAQKGLIVLERDQKWVIAASDSSVGKPAAAGFDVPVESSTELPASIVQYVARTQEPVVLPDAAADARFASDPYIVANSTKSVLCIAMTHQHRVIGILYLENNVTKDAFTPSRLEVLRLLASQAAVALENARLYSYVQRRTEELRAAEERLARELVERERAESTRAALQEEIIRVQSTRLAELSTPIIPITDRIMVMPLIGIMDRERAQQVLITVLQGVQANRAEVVIIDITGVKLVDTDVASTLINTASALRLIGAQAVITGIRPEVAQTLVGLAVDFGAVVTKGTLQSGIAYALGRTGEGQNLSLRGGRR